MKRYFLLPLLIAAICLSSVMLAGCGDGRPSAEFTYITGTAHNQFDPQKVSWLHDARLLQAMFQPLVEMDYNKMKARPGVAKRWEVSDDKTVYTFHLRDNAKWSNGDPVTAHDFVYGWRRAMLPDTGADYTKLMFHIKGAKAFFDWRQAQLDHFNKLKQQWGDDAANKLWAQTQTKFGEMVGLDVPDDHTLIVTLEHPTPYFLDLAAFVTFLPVHRASFEQAVTLDPGTGMLKVDASYWSAPQRLVTNGAYRMTHYKFQQYVRLEKNPNYWDKDSVKTRSMLERIISEPQSAQITYRNGEADFWPDVPSASEMAAKLVSTDSPEVHTQQMAGVYFYNFNCQKKLKSGQPNPLADVRVRRALSMAINRKTIVQGVTRLNQPIARSFVPTGVLPVYQPPVEEGVTFNPERAASSWPRRVIPTGRASKA